MDAASGPSIQLIGSIGELVLKGSLVGPGYLEPSTSTFSAFIEDPVWLLHGAQVALTEEVVDTERAIWLFIIRIGHLRSLVGRTRR